ncbi:MAG: amidohydrolase [Acidimicrobiia bacterium]
MDAAAPSAEVVLVDGDRVVAVGGADLLRRPDAAAAEVVDLAGAVLVPGLIDAHNHLSVSALHPHWHDVRGVGDRDLLVEAIRAQAEAWPDTVWVRCQGIDLMGPGAGITRDDLDAAGLDRPVIVADYTLHQCVVSSSGLDALGIGRDTPDPPGGEIARRDNGDPTGILVEQAWSEAHARSMRDFTDLDHWAGHVADRSRALLAEGITCVHDAACSPEAEALYASMARAGTLPVDVVGMPHPAALLQNEHTARLEGPPTGEGDDRFRVGPMKLFADGGVAIALDTSIGGHPVRYGTVFEDLVEHAVAAARRGFRIAVHAIGNLGVDATLDAYTAVLRACGDRDHRFRLEHAGVTGPAHWRRLAEVGAIAVVQPGFVEHVGEQSGGVRFDDHHWLAFAGLADAGVTLAGSSDDPCAPVSPLWGAGLGASRRTSSGLAFELDQAVDVDDWLVASTRGAALAGGQEAERGSITVGTRADFVVLDDPVGAATTPSVAETWIAGERVFAAREART